MVVGRWRPARQGRGWRRQLRRSRADSYGQEVQLGEAETTAASAWLRTAGVDGIHDGSSGGVGQKRGPVFGLGLGFRKGESEGGAGEQQGEGLHILDAGERGGRQRAARPRRHGAAVANTVATGKRWRFLENPLADLNLLQKGPSADFSNLN